MEEVRTVRGWPCRVLDLPRQNLQDKDKCVACFITTAYTRCFVPTSYSRCLALERVVRSVRVACPHGCATAKMMYHEKMCLGHEIGKKQGSEVRRMGPCGVAGAGGNARQTGMTDVSRVMAVGVWHGNAVNAITVVYERKGKEEFTNKWGGAGGKLSTFSLQPDEYLSNVEGHYSGFNGPVIVRSLKFISNLRTYGPYGKEDGVPFALPAGKIIGFHARTGQFLDAIGTYVTKE